VQHDLAKCGNDERQHGSCSYTDRRLPVKKVSFGRYKSDSARRLLARRARSPANWRAIPAAANAGRAVVNGGGIS
jgi:hypothetical protein